jgi:hypothetical protein
MEQMLHATKISSLIAKLRHKQGYSVTLAEITPIFENVTFADCIMALSF